MKQEEKVFFVSDYMEGADPEILSRLMETNHLKTVGYGLDEFSEQAREKVRAACNTPNAEVFFLVGGTQTNATVIHGLLQSYQGVISADSGHINTHEAGAIEFGGHKVIALPHENGKLRVDQVEAYVRRFWEDENRGHNVMPKMVYLSQPTEYGTLYTKKELEEFYNLCREYQLYLFVDGARLAYALGSKENDVSLEDLGRLCDVFYIGGTKCGALFGEAVVFPKKEIASHFFSVIKQHGALLAKGRLTALQFDVLFTGEKYKDLGKVGIERGEEVKELFREKGYEFGILSPTNQIFLKFSKEDIEKLSKSIAFGVWEDLGDGMYMVRFVTSWATTKEEVERLREALYA